MDDPWSWLPGEQARKNPAGIYRLKPLHDRICRVIATNNDCLLRDSPLIFHYYRRSSPSDSNERPFRNCKLVAGPDTRAWSNRKHSRPLNRSARVNRPRLLLNQDRRASACERGEEEEEERPCIQRCVVGLLARRRNQLIKSDKKPLARYSRR